MQTVSEFQEQFATAVHSGNVDLLLDLYEDGATFVSDPGGPISDRAAIREALLGFLALNPRFRIESSKAVEGGGSIALLETHWVVDGSGPTGFPLRFKGDRTRGSSTPSEWELALRD